MRMLKKRNDKSKIFEHSHYDQNVVPCRLANPQEEHHFKLDFINIIIV